ncbi:arylsulfatase B-like isoform X1 [Bombus affinis]|uniref:arylsulfatase B-like isoform X1 n=2 Tax=Bombus affinis TaxID=309941 RepID=UPI0021B6F48B|nr:arylsulfatase B-like isoform X1 [Bombus affinis]XP_050598218.1 arylsulfatase B-like isoform X1 [Bombus affinis]
MSSSTLNCIMSMSVMIATGCLFYFYVVLAQQKAQAQQRPNIIVIMADDLGWNDVSFHGADQIPTPNIDALAYNGVILQRHYVLPICTPSRTAFLTGRYPIRTGMQGHPLDPGEVRAIPLNNTLLPEYLRKLGYATHLVGKWHVGYYSDYHTPAYRGFDTFLGYYSGFMTYFNHTIEQNHHVGYDLHYDVAGNLSVKYSHEYMTDLITERAEDIILNHNHSKPLYLQLSHIAAHSSNINKTVEVRDEEETNATLGYIEDFDRRKLAGVVTALDESVGRVVQALKQANILENSIILFMSDNGAQTVGLLDNSGSNYPLRGMKFTLFEGGVRGAACVYSPAIKNPSRISNQLIHVTDWLPTFYSAAGGNLEDLEENLDGVDQWATIVSEENTKRKNILLNIDEKEDLSGALMGRYKLINGAKLQYGDYYGDSGMSESYPEYNVSNVLHSAAGFALASVSNVTLNSERIIELRRAAMVVCDNFTSYPKCLDRCLFDVYNDPCETTDVSREHPEVVDEINRFIAEYFTVLMTQTPTKTDPRSYPENFNGTWMPWIKLPDDEIRLLSGR